MKRKTLNQIRLLLLIFTVSTLISCEKGSSDASSDSGKAGSMARFAIRGNFLYTVDKETLNIFDISTPSNPIYLNNKYIGFDIETIFPYKEHLFIGSQWGMYVYSISDPTNPENLSTYSHIYSCDPVVVNDTLAFVTLRSGSICRTNFDFNQMDVIDISDKYNPELIKSYAMTSPKGLGLDGKHLFVCDAGIKVYDITDPLDLEMIHHITGIQTYDVITNDGILLVTGPSGIFQYDYTNIDSIKKISSIPVNN